jgi:hypothetical protein
MGFKEWLASTDYTVWDNAEVTGEAAWDYQQASIDSLLEDRKRDRSRINELEDRAIDSRRRIYDLERWIKGIADDKQMPAYVQQSARSLLAQEYSKVLYRIKPTDQSDHILESVVPTCFSGDAVNYVFRGRIEDCEKVRDELMKGVSDDKHTKHYRHS